MPVGKGLRIIINHSTLPTNSEPVEKYTQETDESKSSGFIAGNMALGGRVWT
jgi:hypothetical protein